MKYHSLEPLIKQYLAEKDVTRGTMDLYHIILTQYTIYLKEHKIQCASTSDVLDYLEWKKSQGYSTRWIVHQTSVIKGLYRYLSLNQVRLGLPVEYARDITEQIKSAPIKHRVSKPVLTIKQAKQLILFTKNNRKYIWHYRDHAIVYLMLTTGMRSVEVRRARKKDLRTVNHQRILYIHGKGRHSADDFVKIAPGVESAIHDYLSKRRDKNPYLFISHSHRTHIPYLSRSFFLTMVKRVLKDAGLEKTNITAHALRHTAATLNLLRGESLESTKAFLRHTNMASTLIYAHHTKRMQDDSENQIDAFIMQEDSFYDNVKCRTLLKWREPLEKPPFRSFK